MLPIDQVGELLSMIDEEQKISFDKEYAENLYRQYNESKEVDDQEIKLEMSQKLAGKQILLIAPGKSVVDYKDVILQKIKEDKVIAIGLNMHQFPVEYIVATRQDVFEQALEEGLPIITTSAVTKGTRGNVKILNYKSWIDVDEQTHDSSFVIIMNFLKACGVKQIVLAGLDGFSPYINDNYSDPLLRRPVTEVQADQRNAYYKQFIASCRQQGLEITFLTPSKYE